MQRRAAIWFTGAFNTTPTIAAEGIAGLMPVHIMLTWLRQHSIGRAATLSHTHPLRALLGRRQGQGMEQHKMSLNNLTENQRHITGGPIVDEDTLVNMHYPIRPFVREARLGDRIRDRFKDCLIFHNLVTKGAPDEVHRGELEQHKLHCSLTDYKIYQVGVEGFMPNNIKARQAVTLVVVYQGEQEVARHHTPAGKVAHSDCTMAAI